MKLKRILAMVLCVAMVLSMMNFSVFAAEDSNLYVSSDYNSETESYGVTRFSNYAAAYAYATANGKTKATIVIEKTTSLSGNTFDNNHKNYSSLAVVIKDGATMGNALSKWDMTYPVTVEAGGTLTCARPKSAGVSNIHIKNKLIIGTEGSDKPAYCYFLSDEYQDCDISIRYNGSVTLHNAVMTIQDLDAQGSFTATDSDIKVDGAFASATFYATTLTDSSMEINGNQITGGLSDFSGKDTNQLGKVTLNGDSSIAFAEGSEVKVAANVTVNGTSSIEADMLTVNNGKKISVNGTSSVSAQTLTNNGTIAAVSGAAVTAATVNQESTGTVTIDGKEAEFDENGSLTIPTPAVTSVAKIGDVGYASVADALADAQAQGLTDVTITLVGETTKESTDLFDLYAQTAFDSVIFKQEDPSKVYYLEGIYTGKRTNNGTFVFDGVNIVVTGQYIFEGNVKLTNNSVVKSVAESNCFIYNGITTVDPGSKLQGVIEDLRGGTLIVDGGRNDGEFNTTPDMQDAILIINWSGDSMTVKNGAYVKINAANEVGRLTVNSGTSLNVYASKLDSYQWIENKGTINTDVNSVITTKELKGAGVITVDASELKNSSATVINADMSGFTGTVSVTNNDDASYEITDAGLVISVVANASVTDSEGNVSYYATLSDALSAAQDGDTITLLADAVLEDTVTIKKSITLDGNGYTITQSAECNNEWALLYFDDEAVLDVTIKNVTFDGIKDGAAVRTLGANITIDNCVFQNCQHTQVQGLVRLTQGSATIKNSKFLDNTCSMVVSFNYDTAGLAGDKLTVENCVFDGNTANSTAVIYYVKGAGCEIKNSQFKNNTVNCANNGATIYLGFQENCTVTGNLFENNSVTDSSTSTRVGGAIFFGYEANISGNAFINNTASNANGDTLGQLCTSTYYECDINLGGNYWGGDAPVYGKDYTVQHKTGDATFTLDTYNASYSLDEDGNVVVGDATDISYVAKVGKFGYETLASALSAAQDGQTIALLANIVLENAVSITKTATLDLNGFELTYNSTTQGEAMITNKGNLTINDSVGTGVINYNYTGAADPSYGKGNYTISNAGTLTVNGGKITIANLSGHAKYPIDNNSTTGDAVLVINGGHLYNYNTSAIRQFCNSTTYKNSVTVNGGLVEGYCAIWVQNPGSKTVNGSLVITGGEVKSTAKAYVNGTADLKDVSSAIYCTIAGNGGAWSNDSLVSITGGIINENVSLAEEAPAKINVNENICNGYVTVPVPEVSKNLVLFDYPILEKEGEKYYRVAVASGIKSRSYAKVGFEVTIGDAEPTELFSTVVYRNLTATFDGVDETITASEFGAGSQYINFANLYFNTELYEASTPLTIRPFAVKFDGDYEYGKETTIDAIYTMGN